MIRPSTIIGSILTLLAGATLASNVYLLDFELRSLEEPVVHDLERYEGKPVLMVFFEPDCSWCYRQVRVVNDLKRQCAGEFAAIAIGVNGNRQALRKEVRRLQPDFPAYQASRELLKSLGGIDATPLSLLGDAEGEFASWSRGYLPADKLLSFMQGNTALSCESL